MFKRRTLSRSFAGMAWLGLLVVPVPAEDTREPAPRSESPGAGSVSADLLRHPIPSKARRMLQKALHTMECGNHQAAIEQLLEVLSKYPASAAYVHSLLGVEYLKTDQFTASVDSFEQAVLLLPHDATNRYNLGLALTSTGNYDRAEQEIRRAVELDPRNATMKLFLDALVQRERASNQSRN